MKLTKDCKAVLNAVKPMEPNNGIRFYTNNYVINHPSLNLSPEDFLGVLDTLAELHAIQWGDKQHTGFCLTEVGREYKQIGRMEAVERWRERLYGFVAGLSSGIILAFILKICGL